MIKRDFHGVRYEEAMRTVDDIIAEVRIAGKTESAEFITGHGVIQRELICLCEQYGLEASVSWHNTGVVTVIIE